MRRTELLLAAALAFGTVIAGPGAASDWTVRPAESRIAFSVDGTFFGAPATAEGRFPSFLAAIAFDPQALDSSAVRVEIDATRLEPNYEDVGRQASKAKYFDTASHKAIRFESKSFARSGPENFSVTGDLTVKGVTKEVAFPFKLRLEGDVAHMEASLPLNRLDFGIGEPPDRSSSAFLEEKVTVTLAIVADRR